MAVNNVLAFDEESFSCHDDIAVSASKMYGNDDLKIITLSCRSTYRVSHKLLRRAFPFKTVIST